MAEKVNHLEVLHHVCRRKHWKLHLHSEPVADRRYLTGGNVSRLCALAVVDRDDMNVLTLSLHGRTVHQGAQTLLDGLQRGGLVP